MAELKRAAAYVRASTAGRGGVPEQIATLLPLAREMGFSLGEDDIFTDRGPGSHHPSRTGWSALEAAVLREREGDRPFACVLVESYTRVSRDVDGLKEVRQRLRAAGAPLRCLREGRR